MTVSSGHSSGVSFQVGDVGPDPPYGAGPRQFPGQGLTTEHWEETEEARRGGIGVSYSGGRDRGGGF